MKERRSDFDVTNTVRVSDPDAVRTAVHVIFGHLYPHHDLTTLGRAFRDQACLFRGQAPEYLGCDTTYHDLQHTLDMTLALARIIDGYERSQETALRLGPERATLGIITALFHDAGYLRRRGREDRHHGAEYTATHVSRGAHFLADYLPRLGLADAVPVAERIIHFTGYEMPLDTIEIEDERYRRIGHMLGTADLMAQMADRCYLEKCRDRLYTEFKLAGMTERVDDRGHRTVVYRSAEHLLEQTPTFCDRTFNDRLDGTFGKVYRYAARHFGTRQNPYLASLDENRRHLDRVLKRRAWGLLRRNPPCFTFTAQRETG